MTTPRPTGSLGDELSNLGIGLLIGAAILAAILRGAGSVAAWITGTGQPAGGVEAGLGVLLNPGDPAAALGAPGLNVVAYWITAAVLILAAAGAGCWGWRFFREHGRQVKNDPYRIPGNATRTEVTKAASETALLRRAGGFGAQQATELCSGGIRVDLLAGRAEKNGVPLELTAAEYKLLCLFLRSPGQVLTKETILNALWDCEGNYVDTNTLTVYIRRLRLKVEDDPGSPQRLVTVRGMGYRWNGAV